MDEVAFNLTYMPQLLYGPTKNGGRDGKRSQLTGMDISLLKTFLEVSRTRHFGRAADALFVTQSAVSARIKLLESYLGVSLFNRRRNDIQLTPAGMRLVKHAETIVRGWERARHEIALDGEGAVSLAVGCSFDLWGILLRDWAAHLRRQSPQLMLQIEAQSADIVVNRLVNGLLDLAFLFEPPQITNLDTKQVAEIALILVSSRQGLETAAAMEQDYLVVDWGNAFAQIHAANFPDLGPPAARFGSGALALDILLDTGGAAYLPESMVQQQLDQEELFRVEDAPVIKRSAFAVFHLGSTRRQLIESVLDVL